MAEKKPQKMKVRDLVVALVVPLLLSKSLMLYFGAQYSLYPGDGWGIALVLTILVAVGILVRFMWKYRHL